MPNELRCCPECGATDFSWIEEYVERGHVIDDGSDVGYREPQGMMEPAHTETHGVDCSHCVSQWDIDELISQDEAFYDDDLQMPWMDDYTPEEPLQNTLSEE